MISTTGWGRGVKCLKNGKVTTDKMTAIPTMPMFTGTTQNHLLGELRSQYGHVSTSNVGSCESQVLLYI